MWSSDIVVKVNAPTADEIWRLRPGATVVSLMAPARSPKLVEQLQAQRVTGAGDGRGARASRVRSRWTCSRSMANVAGYRAVIEAAHEFGRQFTGQVTAAGKVPPARVFVVGAGVAGLAAIGAAGVDGRDRARLRRTPRGRRAGRVDGRASSSRSTWSRRSPSDGYAKEMTAEQEAATAAMYDEEARATPTSSSPPR